ncbi:YolD-like family protein [Desertibacillus haloalkaliphilus]|uniref:YolD-like family protein n=1 Tax=Desertibacillus haloalkaliphilus TaxID=1328930 RepID=UPI001C257F3A|nr:YolD-like family protein [Desertibacillus haloalkaliphilus]MBU8907577.1 YolD-like family protein [Desertibacillus haloalkaliphilus]
MEPLMANNKDRGTLKWTSMMLPEHVAMLKEWANEVEKVPRPQLDPQQFEEFEQTISDAVVENQALAFVYWSRGEFHTLVGHVHYIDYHEKKLRIIDKFEERFFLSFIDIVDVRMND